MTEMLPVPPDPAMLGWPPTLPVEIALKVAPVSQLCAMYGIDHDEWQLIRHNPRFVADLTRVVETLREEGMSFRLKARLQAEEYLKRAFQMIHDKSGQTPPTVQADLIKFVIKAAGLDASKDQATHNQQVGLSISINL